MRVRLVRDGYVTVERLEKRGWPAGFLASFGKVTDDFVAPERPAASDADEARAARLFDGEP